MENRDYKPSRFAWWILEKLNVYSQRYCIKEDLEEEYLNLCQTHGKRKARRWLRRQTLLAVSFYARYLFDWRSTMLKNYLKIALRNIFKQKMYSIINLMGLAVGIVSCLLIVLFISFELSYDNYHEDGDRIYRIGYRIYSNSGSGAETSISYQLAPLLRENFPQVETAANIMNVGSFGSLLVKKDNRVFYENNFIRADNEIFDVLTMPFIRGNPENALTNPGSIVISERMSKKYFGTEDSIGKTLNVNSDDVIIKGMFSNSPANSSFRYDFIASLKDGEIPNWAKQWTVRNANVYVKFKPFVDINATLSQIDDAVNKIRPRRQSEKYSYFVIPVDKLHLYYSDPAYLYIFSVIAVLILLSACINFINLSTARSSARAKEVGIRKVVGALRKQLVYQFIGESLVTALFSTVVALVASGFLLPLLSNITGVHFSFSDLISLKLLIALMFMTVLTGIVAGSYPAFFLSAFKPVLTLKGKFSSSRKGSSLKKKLVVGQFVVSILLITGTMIVYKQLHYMKDMNLGFDKEQKLIIPARAGADISSHYESVKNKMLNLPHVLGASVSFGVPGRMNNWGRAILFNGAEEIRRSMMFLSVDEDFINNYDIEVIEGIQFKKGMSSSNENTFIINATAVRDFGWDSPRDAINKRIDTFGKQGEIIGVVKDFHATGLHSEIVPLVMNVYPKMFRMLTLSVSTENLTETLSHVKEKWQEIFPGIPFDYFFLDTDFNRFYRTEETIGKLFGVFTFIGLFIACLGLLGLAASTAQQRTKEIGIRKVLGAPVESIVCLFGKEFIIWIFAANLIAVPIAYFALNKWLQNFAYRTDVGIWPFLFSGLIVLFIAVITISYQTIKTATANPVDSLRYE